MGHYKTVHCTGCGRELRVGVNTRKPRNCGECNIQRYVDNMASLMRKSGPEYERNVAAIRASRARRAGGGTSETQLSKPSDCD